MDEQAYLEKIARLERENRELRGEIERLKRSLKEALRAAKRQAAPFSRRNPKANPQKPGRKAGSKYGQPCRRFSATYHCNRLVYYETYDNVHKAIAREKQLKGWRRAKKIALIEKLNPRWQDLAENWGKEMLLPSQSIRDVEQQRQRRIKLGRQS